MRRQQNLDKDVLTLRAKQMMQIINNLFTVGHVQVLLSCSIQQQIHHILHFKRMVQHQENPLLYSCAQANKCETSDCLKLAHYEQFS